MGMPFREDVIMIFRYSSIISAVPFPFRIYRVGSVYRDGSLMMMVPQTDGSARKWRANGVRLLKNTGLR